MVTCIRCILWLSKITFSEYTAICLSILYVDSCFYFEIWGIMSKVPVDMLFMNMLFHLNKYVGRIDGSWSIWLL